MGELIMEEINSFELIEEMLEVPFLLHSFPCGTPVKVTNDVEIIKLPKQWLAELKEPYIIVAAGDSMKPNIQPGQKLLIDKRAIPAHLNEVVIYLNGECLIKVLNIEGDKLYFTSHNPAFKPIYLNENDQMQIMGVIKRNLQ